MEREERRKKFHESLKQILFPPPPSSQENNNIHDEQLLYSNPSQQITEVCYDEDDPGELGSSSSNEDQRVRGPKKPTRAQRKRVRKKKIKEDVERRNGMIGPLVAASDTVESVQRNTVEKLNTENDWTGEAAPSKVRHRRRAKKLAKEKVDSDMAKKPRQDCDLTGNRES